MSDRDKKRDELRKKSDISVNRTDELLAEDINKLKEATKRDLDALRPKIGDKETFDKLVEAVRESTSKNESIADLKKRVEDLGSTAISVFGEVVKILKT